MGRNSVLENELSAAAEESAGKLIDVQNELDTARFREDAANRNLSRCQEILQMEREENKVLMQEAVENAIKRAIEAKEHRQACRIRRNPRVLPTSASPRNRPQVMP